MFELWLSAILLDPHFFTAQAVDFVPSKSVVYADAYGSSLVTRNMDLDTIYYCSGQGPRLLERLYEQHPTSNPVGNKLIGCLSFRGIWSSPNLKHYGVVPSMKKAFPALRLRAPTLQTPPVLVDISEATSPNASPQRASASSSPSDTLFDSPTPVRTSNSDQAAASASAYGTTATRGILKRAFTPGPADQGQSRPSPSTRVEATPAPVPAHAPPVATTTEWIPRKTLSTFCFVDADGLYHTVTIYVPRNPGGLAEVDNVIDAIQPATTSAQPRSPSPVQPATAPSPSQTTAARPSEWDQYIVPAPKNPVAPHQVDTQGIPHTFQAPDAWEIQPPHVPDATSRPSPDAAWRQGLQPDPWRRISTPVPPLLATLHTPHLPTA